MSSKTAAPEGYAQRLPDGREQGTSADWRNPAGPCDPPPAMSDYESPDDVRDESGHLVRELHGVTLSAIVEALVERYGWEKLHEKVRINCFASNPSVKSSLTFLRRTPWARAKVEELYIRMRVRDLRAKPRG